MADETQPVEEPKRKAKDNPWYRLATLHGEPTNWRDERTAKNRETWNRWMAPRLSYELKAALREKGWSDKELTPFSEDELQSIAAQVGLPLGAAWIDFPRTHFEADFFAQGFVFLSADFAGSAFSGHAGFERAIFDNDAHFFGVTFSGRANFSSAAFSSHADFTGSAFSGGADFAKATFSGGAGFAQATFSAGADFQRATFREVADFGWVTFRGANFTQATFSRGAHFLWATFSNIVDFGRANFSDIADFEGATFENHALFQNATFGNIADFVNVEMKGPTIFDDVGFSAPPRCFNAKLHEGTTWHGVHWPETPKDAAQARQFKNAYSRLKLEMDKLKNHEDELKFFALEQKCRRVDAGFWKGLPIAIYGSLGDYGQSYMRPLGILVGVVILGAVPIRAHFGGGWSLETFTGHPIGGGALGLSFANTFGFLSIRKDLIDTALLQGLPGWLKVVATIQTILGIVLLFLFGLGIRNRFRIK